MPAFTQAVPESAAPAPTMAPTAESAANVARVVRFMMSPLVWRVVPSDTAAGKVTHQSGFAPGKRGTRSGQLLSVKVSPRSVKVSPNWKITGICPLMSWGRSR